MRTILLHVVAVLPMIFVTSACVGGRQQDNRRETPGKQTSWPEVMAAELAKPAYQEAWGLFSSSAMEDAGQVMVLRYRDRDAAAVRKVPRSGKTISESFDLKDKPFTEFAAVVASAAKLKDLEESFDGVTYVYLHLTKDKSGSKETKKLTIVNPAQSANGDEHRKLVAAFQDLK